jgi:hypothetical protein
MLDVIEILERQEDLYYCVLEKFPTSDKKEDVGSNDKFGVFQRHIDPYLTNRFNKVFKDFAETNSFCDSYDDIYTMSKSDNKFNILLNKFLTYVSVERSLVYRQEKAFVRNDYVLGIDELHLATVRDTRVHRDVSSDYNNDVVITSTIAIPQFIRKYIKTFKHEYNR